MYKAILTRFKAPTNTRGARIVASDCDANHINIPWPGGLSSEAAHHKAAEALRDKMGWQGELQGGGLRNGYAWVFVEGKE